MLSKTIIYIFANDLNMLKINFIKLLYTLFVQSTVKVQSMYMVFTYELKDLAIKLRKPRGLVDIELGDQEGPAFAYDIPCRKGQSNWDQTSGLPIYPCFLSQIVSCTCIQGIRCRINTSTAFWLQSTLLSWLTVLSVISYQLLLKSSQYTWCSMVLL